jgi:hypothetical protein
MASPFEDRNQPVTMASPLEDARRVLWQDLPVTMASFLEDTSRLSWQAPLRMPGGYHGKPP